MAVCHAHAAELLSGARKLLEAPATPNIAYHLALLALEEVGKAALIGARAARGSTGNGEWIEKWLSSHTRKLWWALWSPVKKIRPSDFTDAKELSERLHAQRLASLYVDPSAEALPPSAVVTFEEARSTIELATSRLAAQQERLGEPHLDSQSGDLLEWFLQTVDDHEGMRRLFSSPFIKKYEECGANAAQWIEWAKGEFERLDDEADVVMRQELARRPEPGNHSRPKWQIRIRVYTASHALRPKVLNYWNDRIDAVKLISTGKKDEFLLELSLTHAVVLPDLFDHSLGMAKMMLSFLSIGSTGYFWFDKPIFGKRVLEEIKDLEQPKFKLEVAPKLSFWNNSQPVALTEQHLQHAIECMSTYTPLGDKVAEPIFGPYFQGLALIGKSDIHISTDEIARMSFIRSLYAALQYYGIWNGEGTSLQDALDRAFRPIIPELEHRATVFAALVSNSGNVRPISENMITAKRLVDLFLIKAARDRWRQSLLDCQDQQA